MVYILNMPVERQGGEVEVVGERAEYDLKVFGALVARGNSPDGKALEVPNYKWWMDSGLMGGLFVYYKCDVEGAIGAALEAGKRAYGQALVEDHVDIRNDEEEVDLDDGLEEDVDVSSASSEVGDDGVEETTGDTDDWEESSDEEPDPGQIEADTEIAQVLGDIDSWVDRESDGTVLEGVAQYMRDVRAYRLLTREEEGILSGLALEGVNAQTRLESGQFGDEERGDLEYAIER